MFDLSQQPAVAVTEDAGLVVPIKDVRGEPVTYDDNGVTHPAVLRVAGTYSATYRKAAAALRDRQIKRRRVVVTGEQLEQQSLELIAACILSWEGLANGGQPFPCTRENARLLLTQCPWIREDVEAAMGDHESFFANSSPT